MRIAIVTNLNGKGLTVDANLLCKFLIELGHYVVQVQFDQPCDDKFDLSISLEITNEAFFSIAPKHVWVPNLEWAGPEHVIHARRFDRIWAKTSDAERVLRENYPHVTYTGWLSHDHMDSSIHRERAFLHIGGDSGLKNTNAVIAAWRQWRYWMGDVTAPLTVVSRSVQTDVFETKGVRFIKEVDEQELIRLQNSHLFHLQPSAYEGYGHAIRESQSVGAVLLTTRAGPMAELRAPFEVEPIAQNKRYLATCYTVSGREIREKVTVMLEQPSHMIAKYQVDARASWCRELRESRDRIKSALESVFSVRRVSVVVPEATDASETNRGAARGIVVGILGNFREPHSTENDLAWSLRDMGHEVWQFQEDLDSTDRILASADGMDLLIYVHTHGWKTPGTFDLDTLWKRLRKKVVRTCSFHLDRYWGLNALDRREDNIGKHAFWHTDRVFTADGGNQQRFADRGIQHCWLPPGVNKKSCFLGDQREDLRADVGFVGATGYHPEYPFREELINFLRSVYGDRFRIFQGYRGKPLNDVYASVSVVVGDSCFGGADYYWSDRVPETCGRGGLLLHPGCRGLTMPGVGYFSPGDLSELKDKIDWWLERPTERDAARHIAKTWVTDNDTYHNRMATLLKVMEIG